MLMSIGAVLGGSAPHRTGQPVRRHSHQLGQCEARFWGPTSREAVRGIVLAARRFDLLGRQKGRRNGPLGHVGLEVLEFLGNLVSFKTGRLDPSLDYLVARLRRSRGAIVEALKALEAHGFLDKLRRFEATGITEGPGPRVKQASNAYRLNLPAKAAQLMGRLRGRPPLPDDVRQDQEERWASVEAHKASLSPEELGRFTIESGPLGEKLAQLGRHVQERESARRSEP